MGKTPKYDAMRIFFKLLIFLLILACIAPFFIKGHNNIPLMTLDKLKLPKISIPKLSKLPKFKLPTLKKKAPVSQSETLSSAVPAGAKKIKMYKWKDKEGVWHFSDRKNPGGPYEVFYLPAADHAPGPQASTNSIDDIKTRIQKNLSEIHGKLPSVQVPMTVPYTKIKQLKEDAQQVKKTARR